MLMAVNGTAVAIATAGGLLLYSAVKGKGIGDTARSLLSGKPVPGNIPGAAQASNYLTGLNLPSGALTNIPGVGTDGGSNARAINQFLKGVGFSRAQRAGIMGNIQAESGFNPGSIGDQGTSIGICQWHGGRASALQAFADVKGKPATDLTTQLEFLMADLSGPYALTQAALRVSTDPATAAIVFVDTYEKPADLKNQEALRANYARDLYQSSVTQ